MSSRLFFRILFGLTILLAGKALLARTPTALSRYPGRTPEEEERLLTVWRPKRVAMCTMMWLAMMVAMMLPSTMPMLLLYRRAAPAVSEFLLAIGLPSDVAAFYSDFFDDGAVLLLIRVNPPRRKKIAIDLLKHYGGESVRSTLHSGRAAIIQRRDALYDPN